MGAHHVERDGFTHLKSLLVVLGVKVWGSGGDALVVLVVVVTWLYLFGWLLCQIIIFEYRNCRNTVATATSHDTVEFLRELSFCDPVGTS